MKITFYRIATNSKNETYHASILSVELPSGTSRESALTVAAETFQREMKVLHWSEAADGYEFA